MNLASLRDRVMWIDRTKSDAGVPARAALDARGVAEGYFGTRRFSLRADGVSLIESQYQRGQELPRHEHENAHFCVVLSGRYEEELGGEHFMRRPLDVVWYPPGVVHAERHASPGRHLLIDVSASRAFQAHDLHAAGTIGVPGALRPALELWDALRTSDSLAVENALSELVSCVGESDARRGREPAWLPRVERELRARFTERIALSELAELAGVAIPHLARSWRRFRGTTIGSTLRELRVDYACRRMASEDTPLGVLAREAGFADQSHLGRVFRETLGRRPAELRRRLAREASAS